MVEFGAKPTIDCNSCCRSQGMSHTVIDLVSSDEEPDVVYRRGRKKRPPNEVILDTCPSVDHSSAKKPRAAVGASMSGDDGRHKRTSLKRAAPGIPPASLYQDMDINRSDGDDGMVTSGIIPLLAKFPFAQESTLLCFHYTPLLACPSCSNVKNTPDSGITPRRISYEHLIHIQQRDKWSCGFRNLQMLLSFLMPNLAPSHPFWTIVPKNPTKCTNQSSTSTNPRSMVIPSVKQLQRSMEQSWQRGYDQRGAAHFRHGIVGRPSKVGAVELSSLLTYFQLDSTVIQFVVCDESRLLLGRFVKAYFDRCLGCRLCSSCIGNGSNSTGGGGGGRETSDLLARGIIERLESGSSTTSSTSTSNTRLNYSNVEESCPNAIPPLYLQWEGHSVTVVGVEMDQKQEQKQPCNFLVLDPLKSGTKLKQDVYTTLENFGFLNGVEETAPLTYCLPNSLSCLNVMRLSTKKLLQKDCQLVLSTMDPLKNNTRSECNAITAANRAVERVVNANPTKYF